MLYNPFLVTLFDISVSFWFDVLFTNNKEAPKKVHTIKINKIANPPEWKFDPKFGWYARS